MIAKNYREMISVIGLGYVGAVTGITLAELGNHVIFVDIDKYKMK